MSKHLTTNLVGRTCVCICLALIMIGCGKTSADSKQKSGGKAAGAARKGPFPLLWQQLKFATCPFC